jgi:hypothetical protein
MSATLITSLQFAAGLIAIVGIGTFVWFVTTPRF